MHKSAIVPVAASLAVAVAPFTARAQTSKTPPPPPVHKPGPGDPLPKFHLKALHDGVVTVKSNGQTVVTFTGGVEFSIGDLILTSDNLSATQDYHHIEATGHVVLARGDEVLHGASFVLDDETATFITEDATLVSPPLYLRAARIERGADGTHADNAVISTGTTDGNGEFQLHTATATIAPGEQTLHLTNVAVTLLGVRLVTLRRLTINLQRSRPRTAATGGNGLSLPVIVHQSHLSGLALGLTQPYALYHNLGGRATIVDTTREGIEYQATLGHTLYSRPGPTPRKPFRFEETPTNPDPLRALITARAPVPPPDSVLDFTDITVTSDPLVAPTRAAGSDLRTDLTITRHQEFPNQRQGPLLLSRKPEWTLSGRLPLNSVPIPDDNAEARRALRTPRVALTGQLAVGEYDENRLFGDHDSVSANRVGVTGGLATSPLLIGSHLLAEAQTDLHIYHYQTGDDYRFLETTFNAEYIFVTRTALGFAYITRARNGVTPFYFDQVDTQDEGQIRGEVCFGPKERFTLASVGRYDLDQHKFFDYEIAVAVRGRNIEPRLSFRHLNRQINFGLSFPGLTSP